MPTWAQRGTVPAVSALSKSDPNAFVSIRRPLEYFPHIDPTLCIL